MNQSTSKSTSLSLTTVLVKDLPESTSIMSACEQVLLHHFPIKQNYVLEDLIYFLEYTPSQRAEKSVLKLRISDELIEALRKYMTEDYTSKSKTSTVSEWNDSQVVNTALISYHYYMQKECISQNKNKPLNLLGNKYAPLMQRTLTNIFNEKQWERSVETCAGALGIHSRFNISNDRILNDFDILKINYYKVIKKYPALFKLKIMNLDVNKETYDKFKSNIKEIGKNYKEQGNYIIKDPLQTAVEYFYVNHFTNRIKIKEKFSGSLDCKDFDFVGPISKSLQDTKILCDDLLKLIPKYNSSDTIIICDPPYISTQTYESNLTINEHKLLAKLLHKHEGDFIYFCRITAKGSDYVNNSKVIKGYIDDFFCNKGLYYIDVPLDKNTIERVITSFNFNGANSYDESETY